MYNAQEVFGWLSSHIKGMRLSRLKTLSAIVAGAMKMKGVGVLSLGRAMDGETSAKHRIKRVWRFLKNPGTENLQVSRSLLQSLIPAKGRIIVLCDWTDLDPYQQLVMSIPKDGRAMPFLSQTILKSSGEGSMIEAEQRILACLELICPKEREIIIVADRGFGNTRWVEDVTKWGWHFVQRIASTHKVDISGYHGALSGLNVIRGAASKDFGSGNWTDNKALKVRVVTIHESDSKEPWILITSLPYAPAEIVRIYKRRMWTEAMFRDLKNRNWGLGLDSTRLSKADRHDRLFLVVSIAYVLLMAYGAAAEASGFDNLLKANTENNRVMSLARIGNYFLQACQWGIERAFRALLKLPM